MRDTIIVGCVSLLVTIGLTGHGAQAAGTQTTEQAWTARDSTGEQTSVPIRKVVLFSSGVGYFEHAGEVEGNAATELRFKSVQINDVLKSLVLEDLGGGRAGTIVYPSQDPLSKTLSSFQVDLSEDPSLGELLDQLRGADVAVSVHGEELTGTILGLETKSRVVEDTGLSEQKWWINILTDAAIRSIPLESVQKIELKDPQLEAELHKALRALAQSRDQDKKPVEIGFTGDGRRPVRIGYIVETPIWKTTYRLLMPDEDGEKGKLQGWAIIENQTESDWNDVQLSLVSGRPISFVQDLYQPLYVPRPVVRPQLYASLTPQSYGAGIAEAKVSELGDKVDATTMARRGRGFAGGGGFGGLGAQNPFSGGDAEGRLYAYSAAPLDAAASVAALAQAADVGELFQYTVDGVSLPRRQSAMIPIVTDDVDVERVSIYNQAVLSGNPLNGAILTNTTDKHLLQGPVTVLDDHTYAGDARIDNLPPGQHRLLSYAVDLDVNVNIRSGGQHSNVQTAKIVKGTLEIQRKDVASQDYVLDNKGERNKVLVIEHPRRSDWRLVDTDKPFETTDALYRFKLDVPSGKTVKLPVTEETVRSQSITLLSAETGAFENYSRTGEIPADVRDALAKVIEYKSALIDTQRLIDKRRARVQEITTEQQRIRANMSTVPRDSTYYGRLLSKLDVQETELDKLRVEIDELTSRSEQQRKALEDYLAGLNVS